MFGFLFLKVVNLASIYNFKYIYIYVYISTWYITLHTCTIQMIVLYSYLLIYITQVFLTRRLTYERIFRKYLSKCAARRYASSL